MAWLGVVWFGINNFAACAGNDYSFLNDIFLRRGVIGHDGLWFFDILRAVLRFLPYEYGFTVFQFAISVRFYGFKEKMYAWAISGQKFAVLRFLDPLWPLSEKQHHNPYTP